MFLTLLMIRLLDELMIPETKLQSSNHQLLRSRQLKIKSQALLQHAHHVHDDRDRALQLLRRNK